MSLLLVLHSAFETPQKVDERWGSFCDELASQDFSLAPGGHWNDPKALSAHLEKPEITPSAVVLVMGSGGTERLAQVVIEKFRVPLLLVCDGRQNSLAATLETYSVMKQDASLKMLYVENISVALEQTRVFLQAAKALKKINKARYGLIGGPSPWLLSSDGVTSFGKFSTTLLPIEIEDLLEEFEMADDHAAQRLTEKLQENFGSVEVSAKALTDSARATLAMQQIIGRHQLDGLTIKCFDLLPHGFTACLGMSLTAAHGYVATCEGDMHAAFSMLAGQYLAGRPVWMANPSTLSSENNTITFAHCTVPENLIQDRSKATLTSHMESGLSTAISGRMHYGEVTVFRAGGNFDMIHATTGEIIQSGMDNKNLCRTQAVVRLHSSVDQWIEKTPGNHQVIAYGNLLPLLNDFCRMAGVKLVQ
jgi:L-fucose isomerase-like protein